LLKQRLGEKKRCAKEAKEKEARECAEKKGLIDQGG